MSEQRGGGIIALIVIFLLIGFVITVTRLEATYSCKDEGLPWAHAPEWCEQLIDSETSEMTDDG